MVPEKRHLLFEWTPGVHHAVDPPGVPRLHRVGIIEFQPVADDHIVVHFGEQFRVKQVFHYGFIALSRVGLEFVTGRAESRSAQKVGDQRQVGLCHLRLLLFSLSHSRGDAGCVSLASDGLHSCQRIASIIFHFLKKISGFQLRAKVFRLSNMAPQLKGSHKGCPYRKTRIATA